MRRIAELTEGGFTIFIGNKYLIIRRKFEEYMDNVASKNTVELCPRNRVGGGD